MTNGQTTLTFLSLTDAETTTAILTAIASNYEIPEDEVLEEITDDDAENLLEYLPAPFRMAVKALMIRHRLA